MTLEPDALDLILVLAASWRRIVMVSALAAGVAGLAWLTTDLTAPTPPVVPRPVMVRPSPETIASARREVDERDRLQAGERRLAELVAPAPPPPPPPPRPIPRRPRLWWSMMTAALTGFIAAGASVYLQAWVRAKLAERPITVRREALARMTGRREAPP